MAVRVEEGVARLLLELEALGEMVRVVKALKEALALLEEEADFRLEGVPEKELVLVREADAQREGEGVEEGLLVDLDDKEAGLEAEFEEEILEEREDEREDKADFVTRGEADADSDAIALELSDEEGVEEDEIETDLVARREREMPAEGDSARLVGEGGLEKSGESVKYSGEVLHSGLEVAAAEGDESEEALRRVEGDAEGEFVEEKE
jgi:hypothetical protein